MYSSCCNRYSCWCGKNFNTTPSFDSHQCPSDSPGNCCICLHWSWTQQQKSSQHDFILEYINSNPHIRDTIDTYPHWAQEYHSLYAHGQKVKTVPLSILTLIWGALLMLSILTFSPTSLFTILKQQLAKFYLKETFSWYIMTTII